MTQALPSPGSRLYTRFTQGFASSCKIRELHFRIFPRQNDSRGTGFKGGQHCSLDVRGLGPFFVQASRNVDIDAWVDWDSALNIGYGSSSLPRHVISREAGGRQLLQTSLALTAQELVMQLKNFFGSAIPENGGLDI